MGVGDHTSANRSEPDVSEEVRLARVLDALKAALEAGPILDLKTMAAEHPSIADHLRSCLTALHQAEETSRPSLWDEDASNDDEPMVLGDFLVVRSIARGGMGIVFEAEQISLHRKVALKVLPFASALDQQHVRRFEIEAQAAAQLHHSNIVPIFAVGCERGVHYYAMQFIEGQTLAAVIHDLQVDAGLADPLVDSAATARQGLPTTVYLARHHADAEPAAPPPSTEPAPSVSKLAGVDPPSTRPSLSQSARRGADHFRTVAAMGLQAALALEYAHRQGVIHRDVKPSNLMIDPRGNLWITDFGLARFGEDRGLTMTGDLMGTLRYMSPEQALGRRAFVDHRTDVYSLAATLYEYATLAPAVPGTTHQDILRRIADFEPIPARRIDPKVPHELETILQKAMSREVEGRYTTAQQMADDLKRFLEHKPILAKPPSWWDQAVKWGRRHPSLVASALATLTLAVVMLAVSMLLIGQAHDATKSALELARDSAEEASAKPRSPPTTPTGCSTALRNRSRNWRTPISTATSSSSPPDATWSRRRSRATRSTSRRWKATRGLSRRRRKSGLGSPSFTRRPTTSQTPNPRTKRRSRPPRGYSPRGRRPRAGMRSVGGDSISAPNSGGTATRRRRPLISGPGSS